MRFAANVCRRLISLTQNAASHFGLGVVPNTGGKKQQAKLEISVDTVRCH
jgi:hypothetical protein